MSGEMSLNSTFFNESRNDTLNGEAVWSSDVIRKIAIVASLMLCTFIGNVALIGIILHKKSRRIRRVNIFLLNLAISDLAVACFTMPMEILFVSFGQWVLGELMCKLTVYLQAVTLASATFLLTGMSIDRYQVIVRPMQSLSKNPSIRQKVAAAWIMAFLFGIPQLFIFVEKEKELPNGRVVKGCVSHGYTAQWQRKVNFGFLTMYAYVIPATIMLYCYVYIIKVVWTRAQNEQQSDRRQMRELPSSPRMSVRHSHVSAAKRKVIIMTLTVIIGFLVCLTPYFIINLIRISSNYEIGLKEALGVAENIFMTHSALNPILYGLFTLKIKHIRLVVKLLKCSCVKYNLQSSNEKETSKFNPNLCSNYSPRVAKCTISRANGHTRNDGLSASSSMTSLGNSINQKCSSNGQNVTLAYEKRFNKTDSRRSNTNMTNSNGCCGYRYLRKKLKGESVQYLSSV